jgi:aspartokinase-like uncharacterized kinase
MSGLPVRVVKVGCSLFERPDLGAQLWNWIAEQPPAIHLFIAGGGELADSIKTWDARFQMGEAYSHWMCIRALSITARVLSHILDETPFVRDYHALPGWIAMVPQYGQPIAAVLDLWKFLQEVEPSAPPVPLPHTWQVTTDSIAARLAEVLQADELVLLKARIAPAAEDDFAALAACGYVDDYFPTIAPRLQRVTFTRLGALRGPLQ